MQSKKSILVILLTLYGAACGRSDLDVESENYAVSKPKAAPMGSLGGVCGKNFTKCLTTETATAIFTNLKKSSVSTKCTVKPGTAPKWGEQRTVVMKFQVPRLIDDHKEKNDQLEVETSESHYGWVYANEGQVKLTWRRNGATVAEGYMSSNDSGPRPHTLYTDGSRGGVETLLAASLDHTLQKKLMLAQESCDKELAKQGTFCAFNDDCAFCFFTRATGFAVVGGLTASGLGALAEASGATLGNGALVGIGGAASGASSSLLNDWSCQDQCNRGRCKMNYCDCRDDMCHGDSCSACVEDFSKCCNRAGGTFVKSYNDGYCFGKL